MCPIVYGTGSPGLKGYKVVVVLIAENVLDARGCSPEAAPSLVPVDLLALLLSSKGHIL